MLEALLQGLMDLLRFDAFVFMILGVVIGLFFGSIPGITGLTAIAILLSLVWRMKPLSSPSAPSLRQAPSGASVAC